MKITLTESQISKISEEASKVCYVDAERGQACITLLQLDLILQKMLKKDG